MPHRRRRAHASAGARSACHESALTASRRSRWVCAPPAPTVAVDAPADSADRSPAALDRHACSTRYREQPRPGGPAPRSSRQRADRLRHRVTRSTPLRGLPPVTARHEPPPRPPCRPSPAANRARPRAPRPAGRPCRAAARAPSPPPRSGPPGRAPRAGRCAGRPGAARASSRASASASARAVPGGTTRLTRPIRSASSASTGRPVRIRSSARLVPISRGSRTVPPSISGTPQRRQKTPSSRPRRRPAGRTRARARARRRRRSPRWRRSPACRAASGSGPSGRRRPRVHPVAALGADRLEVGAGAERAARRRTAPRRARLVGVERAERVGERPRGRAVDGVAGLRAVEDDGGDRAVALDADGPPRPWRDARHRSAPGPDKRANVRKAENNGGQPVRHWMT